MEEKKKNLCAMIPESLHARVRQEQEEMGVKLNEYVEKIIREHFEGGKNMASGTRTIAFQVSEELFERLKKYLADNSLSQKQFIVNLIEAALNDAEDEANIADNPA